MRSYSPMTEPEVLAHTIADATKISGLGRTTIYEAIGAGRLEAVKAGNRTLIVAASLRSFLANLPAANITTGRKAAA
jgi:excisionase family DNA binding protein